MENRKYPKCHRIYLPNLSAQAQKFWISMKKRLHWASVVRVRNHSCPSAKLIDKKSPACLHTQESITSIFTMGQNSRSLIIRITIYLFVQFPRSSPAMIVFSVYWQLSQDRMANFPAFIASKSFDLCNCHIPQIK